MAGLKSRALEADTPGEAAAAAGSHGRPGTAIPNCNPVHGMSTYQRSRGFTLIEVMVTVGIIAILAGIALPSYSAYIQRSKVPVAFDGLSSFATRMEQRYQDTGCYAGSCPSGTSCGVSVPTVANFAITCSLSNSGQGFTATATGSGPVDGYTYTITHTGARATTAHPKGSNSTCWSSKGGTQCDG